MEFTGDQLLSLFAGTVFDWSCAWGFTSRESIPLFIDSFLLVHNFFYFFSSVLLSVHVCIYIHWLLHLSNEVVFSQ